MLPRKCPSITVGDCFYRYLIVELKNQSSDGVELAITIQDDDANGAYLHVKGLSTERVPEEESKFYQGRTVTHSIQPRHIAMLIETALREGWSPEQSGPPFEFRVDNDFVFNGER